jgi:tetratricopeptide (TPR) repeat protein
MPNLKNNKTYNLNLSSFSLLIVLLFQINIGLSQSKLYLTIKAENKVNEGAINKGISLFNKVLSKDSTFYRANFGLGQVYFNQYQNYDSADYYFNRCLENTEKDSNYLDLFYFADCKRLMNEPEEGLVLFNLVKNNLEVTKKTLVLKLRVDQYINYCNRQIEMTESVTGLIRVKNIGNNVNINSSEYTTVFNSQDSTFLYNSRKQDYANEKMFIDQHYFENIYKTNFKGEYSEDCKYSEHQRTHFAVVSKVGDSDSMLVYFKNELWIVELKGNCFLGRTALPDSLRGFYHQPSGTFSKNQKSFVFSARKVMGDDLDLYYSNKDERGGWSEPTLFGLNINSEYDEDGPFLAGNDSILYFSSKGFNSSGGYDIFKSELIDGKWSEPIALEYPLNSPAEDIYYNVNEDGVGFVSSNRYLGEGMMDIYKVRTINNLPINEKGFGYKNLLIGLGIA